MGSDFSFEDDYFSFQSQNNPIINEAPSKVNNWEQTYEELKNFLHNGNINIPKRLKNFAIIQRQKYKKNMLTFNKILRLEQLPRWEWRRRMDTRTWDEKIKEISNFIEINGRIPRRGEPLGRFLEEQIKKNRDHELPERRSKILEEILSF